MLNLFFSFYLNDSIPLNVWFRKLCDSKWQISNWSMNVWLRNILFGCMLSFTPFLLINQFYAHNKMLGMSNLNQNLHLLFLRKISMLLSIFLAKMFQYVNFHCIHFDAIFSPITMRNDRFLSPYIFLLYFYN